MPRISAIVVTRNNRQDIGRCLASLANSHYPVSEVMVLDHQSADGTADRVRREFPDVYVLDFWDNPGFGEGNNRGARVASGDYLLLLNPDATVAPEAVGHLMAEFEQSPQLGIAVPKVVLASEPSVINSAGLCVSTIGYGWDRGYLEWDCGQYNQNEPILAGSGCALMVRADVFRAVGGFDASYFLYYEDLDLCWRSWILGRSVHYVPKAVVQHAMKVSGRPATYNEYLDHRNRLRTLLKNLSSAALVRRLPKLLSFEAAEVLDRARKRQWPSLRLRTQAWTWNLRHLPDTLARRRVVQARRAVGDEQLSGLFAAGREPRLNAALPTYRETYDDLVDRGQLSSVLTMGRNDVGALGLGWHGLERFDGRPARWCCGYGIAFVTAPAAAPALARLTISAATVHPTTVIIRTDREERGRFTMTPGPRHELDTTVPLRGDVTRVEILVKAPFVPSDADARSPDHRTLGVAVDRIALEGLAS